MRTLISSFSWKFSVWESWSMFLQSHSQLPLTSTWVLLQLARGLCFSDPLSFKSGNKSYWGRHSSLAWGNRSTWSIVTMFLPRQTCAVPPHLDEHWFLNFLQNTACTEMGSHEDSAHFSSGLWWAVSNTGTVQMLFSASWQRFSPYN